MKRITGPACTVNINVTQSNVITGTISTNSTRGMEVSTGGAQKARIPKRLMEIRAAKPDKIIRATSHHDTAGMIFSHPGSPGLNMAVRMTNLAINPENGGRPASKMTQIAKQAPRTAIVLGIGICLIRNRAVKYVVIASIGVFSLMNLVVVKNYYYKVSKTQFREISKEILDKNPENDKIVSSWGWQFNYYMKSTTKRNNIESTKKARHFPVSHFI